MTIEERTRTALQQAIKESFVFGFRIVMLTAAGLALVSAVVAFTVIEKKSLSWDQPHRITLD